MKRYLSHNEALVTGLVLCVIVGAITVIGYIVYGQGTVINRAETRVTHLERASPCLPDKRGRASNPRECRRSFSKAVTTLTPSQACRIVRKGAALLLVNGHRISSIRCEFPRPKAKPVVHSTSSPSGGAGQSRGLLSPVLPGSPSVAGTGGASAPHHAASTAPAPAPAPAHHHAPHHAAPAPAEAPLPEAQVEVEGENGGGGKGNQGQGGGGHPGNGNGNGNGGRGRQAAVEVQVAGGGCVSLGGGGCGR